MDQHCGLSARVICATTTRTRKETEKGPGSLPIPRLDAQNPRALVLALGICTIVKPNVEAPRGEIPSGRREFASPFCQLCYGAGLDARAAAHLRRLPALPTSLRAVHTQWQSATNPVPEAI